MICHVCGNYCDNDAPEEVWGEHFAPADQGWVCLRCEHIIREEEAWYFSFAEYREDVEEMGLEYT